MLRRENCSALVFVADVANENTKIRKGFVFISLKELKMMMNAFLLFTLKMTCSFCSIVSLRKLISLSFSLRTVSKSETAESDGEGVWFMSDDPWEDEEPTSNCKQLKRRKA